MTTPKKINPVRGNGLIDKILKTELDRRMERIREFLVHEEQLLPTTRLIYENLIKKVKNGLPRHRDKQ